MQTMSCLPASLLHSVPITISPVGIPPPVSQFRPHRRPPLFQHLHPARPHLHLMNSAAPPAHVRPVCCTTTMPTVAVNSLCSPMRWVKIHFTQCKQVSLCFSWECLCMCFLNRWSPWPACPAWTLIGSWVKGVIRKAKCQLPTWSCSIKWAVE